MPKRALATAALAAASLAAAVANSGARLAFALFPLAYQLDPAYPFLPQERFLGFCAERGLDCLDLLPALRAAREGTPLWIDDWHLSPRGHAVAAEEIARFLARAGLLSGPARDQWVRTGTPQRG